MAGGGGWHLECYDFELFHEEGKRRVPLPCDVSFLDTENPYRFLLQIGGFQNFFHRSKKTFDFTIFQNGE